MKGQNAQRTKSRLAGSSASRDRDRRGDTCSEHGTADAKGKLLPTLGTQLPPPRSRPRCDQRLLVRVGGPPPGAAQPVVGNYPGMQCVCTSKAEARTTQLGGDVTGDPSIRRHVEDAVEMQRQRVCGCRREVIDVQELLWRRCFGAARATQTAAKAGGAQLPLVTDDAGRPKNRDRHTWVLRRPLGDRTLPFRR